MSKGIRLRSAGSILIAALLGGAPVVAQAGNDPAAEKKGKQKHAKKSRDDRKADNTGVNKRDREAGEPTADQQKNNQADLDLTARIRRTLVMDESLSTYAHNVKIIAENGKVTLKGPVRSEAEKASVEKRAGEIAGAANVRSEIEIKP
jgi:osmotically-inducible protein OsmY